MLTRSHHVRMSAVPMILIVVLGWTSPARAAEDSPKDPREAARLHYARGLELAGLADYEAALREFTDAYAVSPHYAVLYNIGQAEVALGRPLEAIGNLSKYLRDGQEQVPPARRQEVQSQIALLEALFAELTITTDRSGALITVDGREVGRTPLYQPVRLAAGTHKISAIMEGTAAEGTKAINRTVTLAHGERQVLNLEMPASPAAAAKATEPQPPSTSSGARSQPATATFPPLMRDQQPEPGTTSRRRTMSTVGYSAASVGAALGGAALGVYLWNRGRYQDWQDKNATLRRDTGAIDYHARQIANNQLAESLTRANHLVAGLSIAGGALIAGGITLLIVDRVRGGKAEARPGSVANGLSLGWGWQGSSSGSISWRASW